MVVTHKIVHYTEFLEMTRNPIYSKLEAKVHSNKSLRNPEVVSCKIYLNLYDPHLHLEIENTIKGCLLAASRNEDFPQQEREKAGGLLANFSTEAMSWLPAKVWANMMMYENSNKVNLSIPTRIKEFIKNYYTTNVTEIRPNE